MYFRLLHAGTARLSSACLFVLVWFGFSPPRLSSVTYELGLCLESSLDLDFDRLISFRVRFAVIFEIRFGLSSHLL